MYPLDLGIFTHSKVAKHHVGIHFVCSLLPAASPATDDRNDGTYAAVTDFFTPRPINVHNKVTYPDGGGETSHFGLGFLRPGARSIKLLLQNLNPRLLLHSLLLQSLLLFLLQLLASFDLALQGSHLAGQLLIVCLNHRSVDFLGCGTRRFALRREVDHCHAALAKITSNGCRLSPLL